MKIFGSSTPTSTSSSSWAAELSRKRRPLADIDTIALDAFAQRLVQLPGLSERLREAAYRDLRDAAPRPGDVYLESHLAGVRAALGNLVTKKGRVFDYDLRTMEDADAISQRYGARAISAASSSDDIAVVYPEVPRSAVETLIHARRGAGLASPTLMSPAEVAARERELAATHGAIEQYFKDGRSANAAELRVQRLLNSKHDSVVIAERLGLPLPATLYRGRAADLRGSIDGFPVIAKRDYSAGGSGVRYCGAQDELAAFLRECPPDEKIVIQRFVPGRDVSMLFFLDENSVTPLAVTAQWTEGVEHKGNVVRACEVGDENAMALWPIAAWAQRAGYRGHLGVDGRLGRDGNVSFIECNPRRTAVSTPLVVATQLGFVDFAVRRVAVPSADAVKTVLEDFGFRRGSRAGVVPTMILSDEAFGHGLEVVAVDRDQSPRVLLQHMESRGFA